MKFRQILFYFNMFRVFPSWLLCKTSSAWKDIRIDIDRNLYYRKPAGLGESLKNKSEIKKFGFLCLFDETFRNIVFYRLKRANAGRSLVLKILFPLKKDCEIQCGGGIGPGLVICHGHGTVILAEKIGDNFTCFQGVTIGKNPRKGIKRTMPVIGDNVCVYTNSVVAGPITVGNNVSISAGCVCLRDIPDNNYVFAKEIVLKEKI